MKLGQIMEVLFGVRHCFVTCIDEFNFRHPIGSIQVTCSSHSRVAYLVLKTRWCGPGASRCEEASEPQVPSGIESGESIPGRGPEVVLR